VLPDAVAPAADEAETGPTALLAGAMFRSLVRAEIPESELRHYEEALEDGSPLVMVRAGERYPESMNIMNRCGGEYIAAFVGIFTRRPEMGLSLPAFWFWQRKQSDSTGGPRGALSQGSQPPRSGLKPLTLSDRISVPISPIALRWIQQEKA
jgi:hypothetical protein